MRKNNLLHRAEKDLYDQRYEDAPVPWTIQQTIIGFFLSLVPRIVFSLALGALSGSGSSTVSSTTPFTPGADLANAAVLFVLNGLIQATFLIGPFFIARYALRSLGTMPSLRSILQTLSFRSFDVRKASLLVFLYFIAILCVNLLYQVLLNVLHLKIQTNDQVILQLGKVAPFTMYGLLLLAVFVAPICEEVLFRGFMFAGFLRAMPLPVAICLSAFIFGAAHGDLASFPVLFCIGILLALIRWRTGSLWPGIILHLLNNSLSAVTIILALHGVVRF